MPAGVKVLIFIVKMRFLPEGMPAAAGAAREVDRVGGVAGGLRAAVRVDAADFDDVAAVGAHPAARQREASGAP